MLIISYFLLYAYGGLMAFATIGQLKEQGLPPLLVAFNLLLALALFLTPVARSFLWLGLGGFLVIAVVNGYALNGEIRLLHLFVRLVISLGLLCLYFYAVK